MPVALGGVDQPLDLAVPTNRTKNLQAAEPQGRQGGRPFALFRNDRAAYTGGDRGDGGVRASGEMGE